MKNVNRLRGMYFLVGVFGITLFLGMFIVAPGVVFAPEDTNIGSAPDLSGFGKPSHTPLFEASRDMTAPEEATTHLVFTGDIMLARAVEWAMKEHGAGYPFTLWNNDVLADADAVIGNFEGTIRDTEHIEQTNIMAFDTLPTYTLPLAEAGFTHLSLANNHADDFGEETTEFTRSTLEGENLVVFGDPFASEDFVAHIAGEIPVAIIGFHAFNEEPSEILEVIGEEKSAGNFVIIYPHWGVEYEHEASTYQAQAADAWIAAGADLIIGAHPHVVQNAEIRNGVPIVYSLGNFLFDQDFSTDTKIGAMANVSITKRAVTLTFTPVRISSRQVSVSRDDNETIRTWLQLNELTWTILRGEAQTP